MNSNTQSSQSKHNHTYYNKRKNLYKSLSEKEIPTHDEVVFLNQYEDNQQKAKLQAQKHRNELKKNSQEGDANDIGKVKATKAKNNIYNKIKYNARSKQIQMIKAKCPQTCTQEEVFSANNKNKPSGELVGTYISIFILSFYLMFYFCILPIHR